IHNSYPNPILPTTTSAHPRTSTPTPISPKYTIRLLSPVLPTISHPYPYSQQNPHTHSHAHAHPHSHPHPYTNTHIFHGHLIYPLSLLTLHVSSPWLFTLPCLAFEYLIE